MLRMVFMIVMMMMMMLMILADFSFDGFSVDMTRSMVAMRDVSFQLVILLCSAVI